MQTLSKLYKIELNFSTLLVEFKTSHAAFK